MRRRIAETLERIGCWLLGRAYAIEPGLLDVDADADRIRDAELGRAPDDEAMDAEYGAGYEAAMRDAEQDGPPVWDGPPEW